MYRSYAVSCIACGCVAHMHRFSLELFHHHSQRAGAKEGDVQLGRWSPMKNSSSGVLFGVSAVNTYVVCRARPVKNNSSFGRVFLSTLLPAPFAPCPDSLIILFPVYGSTVVQVILSYYIPVLYW